MPTVYRWKGFRFVVYPNDHRPAHVHVMARKKEAVFKLNCPDGPPELARCYGLSLSSVKRLHKEVQTHLAEICAKWKEIHDRY